MHALCVPKQREIDKICLGLKTYLCSPCLKKEKKNKRKSATLIGVRLQKVQEDQVCFKLLCVMSVPFLRIQKKIEIEMQSVVGGYHTCTGTNRNLSGHVVAGKHLECTPVLFSQKEG